MESFTNKGFLIKTMGCKSNQLEGVLIEENLIENGYKKTEKISDADFFILNSCTVTHKSDNEAFQILNRIKKQNPQIKTVLTGCIAQTEKEKLLENPSIDIVLGNDEKLEISKYIENEFSVSEISDLSSFHQVLLHDTGKTRASLKIQDGCDHRCSYCIIPFARGKNRSADIDFILDQIKIYEAAGFKEIMLTGIHIGQWNHEGRGKREKEKEYPSPEFLRLANSPRTSPSPARGEGINPSTFQPFTIHHSPFTLLHLLQIIEEHTSIERFRLGSLNPLEISDEMLEFLKNSKKFCPHFHLSLQSMCDKTLKSMNRHYSVAQALELIEKISKIFPLGFIGSDIIAGFAGESEEDFQTTIENLKKSKLTQIHTFPYSVRKGTAAEKFEGHLPQKIKNERAGVIKEISAQKFAEFLRANLNSTQEVLIEKNLDKKTGMFKGVTRNYLNVLIKPDDNLGDIRNTLQTVKIEEINPVVGRII